MTSFLNIKNFIFKYFISILIMVCSISLINKYYTSTRPIEVRIYNETKFSAFGVGPYNTIKVPVEDTYNKLIDIGNFSFINNPQTCKNYDAGLLLVIIVSSNPSRYENREVIRNTWGRNLESIKLVFLFGESENHNMSLSIKSESLKYGDIVQGNFIDAYRNMTYKHLMGLKWVSHHCPTAKYILKTDDDVVINTRQLQHFLAKELSPWGAQNLIACHVSQKVKVQRAKKLKWSVSKKEYPAAFYPPYCAGWAILYSQDVVRKLLKTTQSTPYFWIDDVHITGVCAQKIGVAPTSFSNFIVTQTKLDKLKSLGAMYIEPLVFGPTQLGPKEMKNIYNLIVQSYT